MLNEKQSRVFDWKLKVGRSMLDVQSLIKINVQHRTSNEKDSIFGFLLWKLNVGRSMLDVRSVEKTNVQHPTLNIERRMEKIRYFRTSNE